MSAAPYDIVIEQGACFDLEIGYKDMETGQLRNLTGWTAKAQVRAAKDNALVLDLTTENGRIVLGDGNAFPNVKIHVDDADTAVLATANGRWDLFLYDTQGHARRLLKGAALIDRRTTQ